MGVQPRHRHARHAAQAALQRGMGDLQRLQHVVLRHRRNRIAQRHMDADQHGAQLVVGQHHAHGHAGQRHALVGGGLGLQQLGVPRKIHARSRQRLLVQGRGDQRRHLAAQGRAGRPDHSVGCGPACCRTDLAPGLGAGDARHRQHGHAARGHGQRFVRRTDLGHRQAPHTRPRNGLGRAPQRDHIAHHKTMAQQLGRVAEGLGHDLGPDAGGVSLGDGDGVHGFLKLFVPLPRYQQA